MPALTLRDILALDPVRGTEPELLAGEGALDRPVRWVHSSEVYEGANFLDGGELLLTNGFGLTDADEGTRRQYVRELAARGAAGLAVEVGRSLVRMPEEVVDEARRLGLPLIALHRVVPFVRITEAANRAIVARGLSGRGSAVRPWGDDHTAALLADLADGQPLNQPEVEARAALAGFHPGAGARLIGVSVHGARDLGVIDRAARALGGASVLRAVFPGDALALVAWAGTGAGAEAGARGMAVRDGARARTTAPRTVHAGARPGSTRDPVRAVQDAFRAAASAEPGLTVAVGHAVAVGSGWLRWSDTLRAARTTLELALTVPPAEPPTAQGPTVTSSRALALERELTRGGVDANRDRLARLVQHTLGPLLAWEAAHPSDLVRTLEVHLRHGCSPTRTAALLHIGRQSLYQRLERIETLLGLEIDDPDLLGELLAAACAHRVVRGRGEASVRGLRTVA
ncbi:PucR family transcriptional regulator [Streptomyces sp. NBC_01236]|uniref:PucR family transcriptional regulator n=1 Tax=Streptomyces sp. NBC_01236 TaxID=2903789 RepID=UPI002E10283D|nr:PucR family transcriptional regulator [Streptomyces sp. NBC_01236]